METFDSVTVVDLKPPLRRVGIVVNLKFYLLKIIFVKRL